jgi:hypothetical protein
LSRAVLRMAGLIGKKYDLDLDDFIVNALDKKNLNYRPLHKLVKEEYRRGISFETFGYHVNWLSKSGLIAKDSKYAPYYLTEKCKQLIRTETLVLAPPKTPKQKLIEPTSTHIAFKRIHANILLLLFKSDSTYEFATIENLEYFLSQFGLSTSSLPVLRSVGGALHKSLNELYKLAWVAESDDGRISVSKREFLRSPNRNRNSISYICNIKGIKYPIDRYRSEPYRKTGIKQDEIRNTLSLMVDENVLQKPVEYHDDSIYLAADIDLYDLLSLYNLLYSIARSTLINLWNLREPTSDEVRWLQRIEGDSKVARFIIRAKQKRKKRTYYERQRRLTNLIKRINNTKILTSKKHREWMDGLPKADEQEPTTKEWIEKEYQETRSNPKYQFIISEIEEFAFPNWFQRIQKRSS